MGWSERSLFTDWTCLRLFLHQAPWTSDAAVAHGCTIYLWGHQHRNPNINIRDHLVGRLTNTVLAAKNPLRRWWRGCKRFNQGEALEADCLKISLQSTLRQLHREVLYYCRGTVNYWNLPVHAFDRELSGGRVRGWRGGVSAGRGGRVWPNPSSLLHRRSPRWCRTLPQDAATDSSTLEDGFLAGNWLLHNLWWILL